MSHGVWVDGERLSRDGTPFLTDDRPVAIVSRRTSTGGGIDDAEPVIDEDEEDRLAELARRRAKQPIRRYCF